MPARTEINNLPDVESELERLHSIMKALVAAVRGRSDEEEMEGLEWLIAGIRDDVEWINAGVRKLQGKNRHAAAAKAEEGA